MATASITIDRQVAWFDTDASGQHHFTAVLRWVEDAENALLDRLGLSESLAGRMPRAHVEVDYSAPLHFRDTIDVTVAITAVGRTSLTYEFSVDREGRPAAVGRYVTVLVDDSGSPTPLPAGLLDT